MKPDDLALNKTRGLRSSDDKNWKLHQEADIKTGNSMEEHDSQLLIALLMARETEFRAAQLTKHGCKWCLKDHSDCLGVPFER